MANTATSGRLPKRRPVWALYKRGTTPNLSKSQERGVYFPIAVTREQFNGWLTGKRPKLPGVRRADIGVVRRYQPYKGAARYRSPARGSDSCSRFVYDTRDRRNRTPYALRHTYASNALAAGVPPLDLARYMGTSLAMLDATTYGHLVKESEEVARARLDAFAADRLRHYCGTDRVSEEGAGPQSLARCGKRTTGLEPATLGLGSQCSTS
jgi:hypothetical protein